MDKFWLVVSTDYDDYCAVAYDFGIELKTYDKDFAESRMIELKELHRDKSYFLMESVGFAKIGCTSGAVYADPIE